MFLIADSGSTKTDWILVNHNKVVKSFGTVGFNPYFVTTEQIIEILSVEYMYHFNSNEITDVYFYGAGCSATAKCLIVESALKSLLPNANVNIFHDILGAARAVCGNSEGIACILGTGSNSCYYDGKDIVENLPSYGFMFGDEGSGCSLGKYLINDYMRKLLPDDLHQKFLEKYDINIEGLLTNIYKKPNPNRYLASFAPFFSENINHNYVKATVEKSFNEFFSKQVSQYSKYKDVKINCVGSIAFYFKDIFKEVAKCWGCKTETIIKNPIDGLLAYHTNKDSNNTI